MKNPAALLREFPVNVRLLQMARLARSIGQGLTVVSFTLYLHVLGYGGAAIGAVLMSGLVFGAALTAIIGPLSDRLSRRRMLLVYEVLAAAAALATMLSSNDAVLIVAATIAGFGRGANGAAGPFSPVEQAWIAHEVEGATRRRALSLNATLGFLGMATGAALAFLPSLLGHGPAGADTYRLLFVVPLIGSLAAIACVARTRDLPVRPAPPPEPGARSAAEITRQENRQLRKLALANAINGLAIGIIGPLMAYWFLRRYGHGLAAIGPALAISFVAAAAGSAITGRISVRIGPVRAVLWMRAIGIVLLAAMPFAPVFWMAAALYAVRSAVNRGTVGARQAVTAELTRAERRGLAASVQNLSLQIPRAVGPLLGGWLIHAGDLTIPFLIAAALQAVYVALYAYFFHDLDRAEPARLG
ncbi:MAG TPA: MFS transporter [Pseudolabrys sp.]|nr:MFS transporter [Pseudolabrys sp.]